MLIIGYPKTNKIKQINNMQYIIIVLGMSWMNYEFHI